MTTEARGEEEKVSGTLESQFQTPFLPPQVTTEVSDHARRVAQVLNDEVAPALGLESGTIQLIELDGRIARIRLPAGCVGCSATLMALMTGLEQELHQRVPEVDYVEIIP